FDLRILRQRAAESRGKAGKELFRILLQDQFSNIRLMVPLNILFHAAAWWAISRWPDLFLGQGRHFAWGLAQLGASVIYLAYGLRFYRKISPLITATREEWAGRS